MASPAGALLLNWFDLDPKDEPAFEAWHNREHVPERVALPGFLACRRFVAAGPRPVSGRQRLIVYDASGVGAFSSADYRRRLESPTELTMRIVPTLRRVSRAILETQFDRGVGQGTWLTCVAFPNEADFSDVRPVIDDLIGEPSLTRVTFAVRPATAADAKCGSAEGRATQSDARSISACLLIEASTRNGVVGAARRIKRSRYAANAEMQIFRLSFVSAAVHLD